MSAGPARADGVLSDRHAIVVLGVGSAYRPLPVGEHTLEITGASELFGLVQRTYHISVTPPGRR